MTINELKALNILDENAYVAVLNGDANRPHKHFTGHLVDMPKSLGDNQLEVNFMSAMNDSRKEKLGLNINRGWIELWIED